MNGNIKGIIEDYYAAWCAHDIERICSFFTEDCFFEDVPTGVGARGIAALREVIAEIFQAVPDLQLVLGQVDIGAECAVAEWKLSGTLAEDLADIKATGKAFASRTASVIEFREDKICRLSDYGELSSLRRRMLR